MIPESISRSVLKLQIIFTFVRGITVMLCIYFWSLLKDMEGQKWFPILKKALLAWDLDLGPCVVTSLGFRNTCFTKTTGACVYVCVFGCREAITGLSVSPRGRRTLLGRYFKEQVLSSKTQEVVEHPERCPLCWLMS